MLIHIASQKRLILMLLYATILQPMLVACICHAMPHSSSTSSQLTGHAFSHRRVGHFFGKRYNISYMPCFFSFMPCQVPHIQPSNWLGMDLATVEWATFINVMFWNLNYWDSVSTLAGEVDNPSKTFPRQAPDTKFDLLLFNLLLLLCIARPSPGMYQSLRDCPHVAA